LPEQFLSCKKLLQTKTRSRGLIRTNRGIPHDLEIKAENMMKGQQVLHRKGEVLVHVWKEEK
jgi:hypothetical protein